MSLIALLTVGHLGNQAFFLQISINLADCKDIIFSATDKLYLDLRHKYGIVSDIFSSLHKCGFF